MNAYKFLYLCWLLPLCFIFLFVHQGAVYIGINNTYENGTSYTSEVLKFDIKQIAAQTNGYIILKFTTKEGKQIEKKLSLPVEMAGELRNIRVVPIRYQADAFQEIVIMPAFQTQKNLVWTNMAMAGMGLLITFFIALAVHRFAHKKLNTKEKEVVIERVDL